MTKDIRDDELKRRRIDCVYTAMSYVAARCPRQYDYDMEERFQAIIKLLERSTDESPQNGPDEESGVFDDTLGRNYLVSQCATLLLFANQVQILAFDSQLGPLKAQLTSLWTRLEDQYKQFFGEPSIAIKSS